MCSLIARQEAHYYRHTHVPSEYVCLKINEGQVSCNVRSELQLLVLTDVLLGSNPTHLSFAMLVTNPHGLCPTYTYAQKNLTFSNNTIQEMSTCSNNRGKNCCAVDPTPQFLPHQTSCLYTQERHMYKCFWICIRLGNLHGIQYNM